MEKTLLVLAAGMGSRFGGLKQIEPVGPSGEFIIDYSIYDAIRSGFTKVVFVIKKENYDVFKETIGKRIENHVKVEYAFQTLEDIPEGYNLGKREKPLGTGHAIYAAREYINENFGVINSDDFYGYDSIKKMGDFLDNNLIDNKERYCLIGYKAINTITENGSVKRGICNINDNKLISLDESIIEKTENGLKAKSLVQENERFIKDDTLVSMNLLGFPKEFMNHIKEDLNIFLEKNKEHLKENVEYLLPDVLTKRIRDSIADVEIIETSDKWYGMTYQEDKEEVEEAIKNLIKEGIYPKNLWS